MRTKTINYAAYFAIEKELVRKGIPLERDELIAQFTDEKKYGLRDLTPREYYSFIAWLNETFELKPKQKTVTPSYEKLNKQRRKIIALLTKVGYTTPKGDADMPRIYAWVKSHGYAVKPLNKYTEDELPKLVYQAEQFYKSHIERL